MVGLKKSLISGQFNIVLYECHITDGITGIRGFNKPDNRFFRDKGCKLPIADANPNVANGAS